MQVQGTVFKYGDNVDTDVIIPARYLNTSDPAELAKHCMEDLDKDFVKNVQPGISLWRAGTSAAALPGNMLPWLSKQPVFRW